MQTARDYLKQMCDALPVEVVEELIEVGHALQHQAAADRGGHGRGGAAHRRLGLGGPVSAHLRCEGGQGVPRTASTRGMHLWAWYVWAGGACTA